MPSIRAAALRRAEDAADAGRHGLPGQRLGGLDLLVGHDGHDLRVGLQPEGFLRAHGRRERAHRALEGPLHLDAGNAGGRRLGGDVRVGREERRSRARRQWVPRRRRGMARRRLGRPSAQGAGRGRGELPAGRGELASAGRVRRRPRCRLAGQHGGGGDERRQEGDEEGAEAPGEGHRHGSRSGCWNAARPPSSGAQPCPPRCVPSTGTMVPCPGRTLARGRAREGARSGAGRGRARAPVEGGARARRRARARPVRRPEAGRPGSAPRPADARRSGRPRRPRTRRRLPGSPPPASRLPARPRRR